MKNKSYCKLVAIFALVFVIASLLWFALPSSPCYAQGGYQVVGGGGAGEPYPGFTPLREKIDVWGVLTKDVTAKSPDKLCQLTINKGTKALNKAGDLLAGIIMVEMKEPPAPPPSVNVIGLVYDLRPAGATFDPPITIMLTYDPADIPEGFAEEDLVIAMWDKEAGDWVNLASSVDPVTHTISAPVSHLTAFAVFTTVSPKRPATFTTSDLTISPFEVDIGQSITISVTISNTGDLADGYEVTLKINNVIIDTKKVWLGGQASQKVTFTTIQDFAGSYAVSVNGLSGTFTVKPAPLPTPAPAPPPAPPPVITAPVVPPPAPPPTVPTPAPPTAPTPAPTPSPPVLPVKLWLTGSIIAALIIISLIVWLAALRRRVKKT